MCSLHQIGAAIDNEGNVHQPYEASISIAEVPWQHLRQTMQDKGVRARNAFACQHRKQLQGSSEIDVTLLQRCIQALNNDDARWLKTVIQLDTWSDSRLEAVSDDSDGTCHYCGHHTGDIVHLIWKCQCFAKQREDLDPRLAQLDPDALPKALRLGIPLAMGAEESVMFWPNGREAEPTHLECLTKAGATYHGYLAPQGRMPLSAREGDQYSMNARQFVALLKTADAPLELELPLPCDAPAPVSPNVYSDGSLKNPKLQDWSLGGFGVWWPGRQLRNQPLSFNENEYTQHREEPQGISVWGATTGQRASSCRTELTAGLLAIHQDGPTHICSDSRSFVNKAQKLADGANLTRKLPWTIQPDGDLWQKLEQAILSKGRQAVKFT